MGQDYYQTYAHTRVERVSFFPALVCLKHRKINGKWPEMALFSLCAKARFARNSGDIPV